MWGGLAGAGTATMPWRHGITNRPLNNCAKRLPNHLPQVNLRRNRRTNRLLTASLRQTQPRMPLPRTYHVKSMPKKSKSTKPVQRVLVAGITPEQDELLRTVQYRIGTLGGRDTLFAAVRKYVQQSGSDVKPPTKRQVGAFVKGEPAMQRQQTTGAALPEHKPVAVVRRSRPLMYVQFDAMQLPASDLKETVTYMPKSGTKKVTVPLVRKFLWQYCSTATIEMAVRFSSSRSQLLAPSRMKVV
jgi:hypothetical protein